MVRKNGRLPEIKFSGDASKFSYTNKQGKICIEDFAGRLRDVEDVRWFVSYDDTIFIVENLVTVLVKYGYTQFYYSAFGSSSEHHTEKSEYIFFLCNGICWVGFAVSYPLAMELEKMQYRCIQRYLALYVSDDRIQVCMSELGVRLTEEAGFHQVKLH